MSDLGDKMKELLAAGDELATWCTWAPAEAGILAEKWWRLRGEAHHETHQVLDELIAIVRPKGPESER